MLIFLQTVARPNKGIALISVLVALLVIMPIVYNIAYLQKTSLKKAYANKSNLALISDALAVETWARQILFNDLKSSNYDSYTENWALALAPTLSDVSVLSGKILDLNSKLNLNNLVSAQDTVFVDILHRLFVSLEINEVVAASILNALQDWLDVDNQVRTLGGAEDNYYLLTSKPYRAANNKLTHISELKLLRGMNQEIYDKITPFVSVLPTETRVNINTAPQVILEAIFPQKSHLFIGSSTYQIAEIEYKKLSDFAQEYQSIVRDSIPASLMNYIDVSSHYFVVDINTALGDETINLLSFLYKDKAVKTRYRYIK